MVKALLDGTKTQTRRIVKPSGPGIMPLLINLNAGVDIESCKKELLNIWKVQVGDILWIRETWTENGNGLIQ